MDPGKRRFPLSATRILPSPFYRHFLSPLDVVAVLPLNEHILGLLLHLVVANTHPQRLARRVYTDMNYILTQRSQFIYC